MWKLEENTSEPVLDIVRELTPAQVITFKIKKSCSLTRIFLALGHENPPRRSHFSEMPALLTALGSDNKDL